MIASLRGTLTEATPGACVIECDGVGYLVQVSAHTGQSLPPAGREAFLRTRQIVREDSVQLFGFADAEELKLFDLLIAVSGVGPKLALAVLSYVVARPFTSLERLGSNTVAVAIALLLTGFFLMINRRKAITQVLALLTMENGVMLAAIALTTYGMPLVVELGIFFDVVIAVMVLGLLIFRIRETFASMDTSKLSELKW